MRHAYIVELRSAPIVDLDADVLERFSDEIFDDRRLLGPAPSADLALRVLELRTAIEAASPSAAIELGLAAFARATKKVRLGGVDVVDISAWLDDDSEYDRRELLSGADIAQRLGITRQRIAQLVAEKGRFPRPAATFGTISVWQWGDVADWIAAGGRGSVNRLAAEAVLQIFAYAKDEDQKAQALKRMIDLANDANESASSFLEGFRPSVVFHDDETSRWMEGPLLRKYEDAKGDDEKTSVIDLLSALKRSVERERGGVVPRTGKKTA